MKFNSNEFLHTLDFKVKQVLVYSVLRYFSKLREMDKILQQYMFSLKVRNSEETVALLSTCLNDILLASILYPRRKHI